MTELPAGASPAPQTAPDHAITISLGAADKAENPYRLVPFAVPEGVTRLEVRLDYPKAENCVIDLGAADPELGPFPSAKGLRGWSGGARSRFFIGRDAATPGYVPGDIRTGTWHVILGLYRLPEVPVAVRLEVRLSREDRELVRPRPVPPVARRQPGWYCGDLQSHTFHSDAYGAPQHLHATAVREGLDFLAVTDHNTTTQQQAYFDTASSEELVFVPAYEFTTEFGHANVFGAREITDFRATSDADVATMVARIRESGALFSINHDKPAIPWDWALPGEVDCMEVWQTHWLAGNYIALARYQARLAEGRRITAIGGSDYHQPATEPDNSPLTLARPCTWLWLEELSVPGILEALRKGRSFVTESPTGPWLTIAAGAAGHGDTVPGGPVELTVATSGAPDDRLEIWDATGAIAEAPIEGADWSTTLTLEAPQKFVRAEIVADASHRRIVEDALAFIGDTRPAHADWDSSLEHPIRRALTNPIYVG